MYIIWTFDFGMVQNNMYIIMEILHTQSYDLPKMGKYGHLTVYDQPKVVKYGHFWQSMTTKND